LDAHPPSSTAWARLRRADGGTVVLVVGGPLAPGDAPWLCERVRVLLEHSDDAGLVCEVDRVIAVEAGTVDVLARIALVARRLGRPFRLCGVPPELADLLRLVGLRDLLAR
jgi:anti-anti-sigma regulatory factor